MRSPASILRTAFIFCLFFFAGFVAVSLYCDVAFGSWEDCVDATCRLYVSQGRGKRGYGTGCCYAKDNKYYYVVTCKHVVGNSKKQVWCEFWSEGRLQSPVIGKVVPNKTKYDVACVRIPVGAFEGYAPMSIPLASVGYTPEKYDSIVTVGCAKAAWVTLARGHVVSYDATKGDVGLKFYPRPASGRSGSAVFDDKGEYIIAVLRARGDTGVAVALPAVRESLGHMSTNPPPARPRCPDGKCPFMPTPPRPVDPGFDPYPYPGDKTPVWPNRPIKDNPEEKGNDPNG